MPAYTGIANGDIDQDSPGTQPLFTALRDDPIAMVEGEVNAPVNRAMWHPYNRTINGGSGDGVIYDHAVDGNVGSVETPDLEVGYQYSLMLDGVSCNTGTTKLLLNVRRSTDDALQGNREASLSISSSAFISGSFGFPDAGLLSRMHKVGLDGVLATGLSSAEWRTTGDLWRINRILILWELGRSFDAGKIYLLRRKWEAPE